MAKAGDSRRAVAVGSTGGGGYTYCAAYFHGGCVDEKVVEGSAYTPPTSMQLVDSSPGFGFMVGMDLGYGSASIGDTDASGYTGH